jgi:hypothetical protein
MYVQAMYGHGMGYLQHAPLLPNLCVWHDLHPTAGSCLVGVLMRWVVVPQLTAASAADAIQFFSTLSCFFGVLLCGSPDKVVHMYSVEI